MLRLMGAGLLLVASSALGFGAAGELKMHVRELEGIILSLEAIERELSGRLTPLPELLQQTAQSSRGGVREFYKLCWDGLNRQAGRPFSKLWQQALEATELHLEEDELALMAELGGVLGRYDCPRQVQALRETKGRMEQALARAREQQTRMGKVYGTLGMTAGAFLAIVLL